MNIDWTTIIATALQSLIPLAITAIGCLLLRYLKKKGATDNQIALATEAFKIFQSCVLNVNQTFVDALKEQGQFDEHAQELARIKCQEQFELLISEEMKLAINALYGSLDAWIDINREALVWQAKQEKKQSA